MWLGEIQSRLIRYKTDRGDRYVHDLCFGTAVRGGCQAKILQYKIRVANGQVVPEVGVAFFLMIAKDDFALIVEKAH